MSKNHFFRDSNGLTTFSRLVFHADSEIITIFAHFKYLAPTLGVLNNNSRPLKVGANR